MSIGMEADRRRSRTGRIGAKLALALAAAAGLAGCSRASTFCVLGFCFGEKRQPVARSYLPERAEFQVRGPFHHDGKTSRVAHRFKLGERRVLKGTSFGYDLSPTNGHGQDAKIFHLEPEDLAFYHRTYAIPDAECPSAWMHRHLRIHVLVGANDAVSKKLRDHRWEIRYGGTPFAYEGHFLDYADSTLDGEPFTYTPAAGERAASNVGYAEIPYRYFLVTGFADPDPGLARPEAENRAPASR